MSIFPLPQDKILHLITGGMIGLAVTAALGGNAAAGFCAAMLAGCAKEWIWDAWLGRGDFDLWDAVATTFGGLIGVGLYKLMTVI